MLVKALNHIVYRSLSALRERIIHGSHSASQMISLFNSFSITLLTIPDGRSKLALLLLFSLFIVAFVVDALIDLLFPDLVSLKERRPLTVLMGEILACSRHDWLESALFHFFDLVGYFFIQNLLLECLFLSESCLVEMFGDSELIIGQRPMYHGVGIVLKPRLLHPLSVRLLFSVMTEVLSEALLLLFIIIDSLFIIRQV